MPTKAQYEAVARCKYGNPETTDIHLPRDPKIRSVAGGAYVQAWVYVTVSQARDMMEPDDVNPTKR